MFAYLSGMCTTVALFAPNSWVRVGAGLLALVLIGIHAFIWDKNRGPK